MASSLLMNKLGCGGDANLSMATTTLASISTSPNFFVRFGAGGSGAPVLCNWNVFFIG